MINRIWNYIVFTAITAMCGLMTGSALAGTGVGQPAPGQMGIQGSVTQVGDAIHDFHDRVNIIIIAIAVFVMLLMLYVIFRYSAKANPKPANFSHNTTIEVLWTVLPILILVYIGVYSFKLLFLQYEYPKPDLTIKATANAWYWEHSYPDQDNLTVTSTMIRDEDVLRAKIGADQFEAKYGSLEGLARTKALYADAKPLYEERGLVRQLSVDNEIAVPVNAVVHVLVTSADVIHAWTIPSFGSKLQAVPGRITATWFKATKTGVYYGQCSVLCGKDHANMPIAVRVVEQDVFDKWVAAAKERKWDEARKILTAATASSSGPKFALADGTER
jgi:cytochrome c oxidase subunit II